MKYTYVVLFAASLFLASCGGGKSESTQHVETNTPENPAEAMQKALENLNDGKVSEPVDHRKLRDLLKEEIEGFTRVDYESQSAGAMGFNMSHAEGNYTKGDARIKTTIMDTGGAGMAMMSVASWSMINVDKENQDGYERTGSYKGYKAFEKFDKRSNSCELAVIVENRFIVTFNGQQCDMNALKNFADDVDLVELKKLI